MIPQEYVAMYVGANSIALAILGLALRRPRLVTWIWVAIFLWAATVNTITASREPWVYLTYGALTPSDLYRDFINGWFAAHIQPFVLAIAAGQLSIAILLVTSDRARRLGVIGACVFLLAIAPLGVGSGFPFSLVAIASLLVMERRLVSRPAAASPAAAFIAAPDVSDEHQIIVRAPADLVLFVSTRLDLQSLAVVHAIFKIRSWLMGDTLMPRRPLGLLADTMVLGWGVLAHRPGRSLVMGAVARPWERDVTFRAVAADAFEAFDEPGYVKIVWTLEAAQAAPGVTRFRTETRVKATDAVAQRKFWWYWLAFAPGIRLIRWNLLRALRREAQTQHRAWLQGRPHAGVQSEPRRATR